VTEGPAASAALTASLRAAIGSGGGRALGSGYQASVRVYETRSGSVVVKDPHRTGPLASLWRHLLRREEAVYARLAGIEGIPRSFGLVDGKCLALEYIAGPSLREHESRITDREVFFAKLLATLKAMHAAGVAHGDLKRKDNIIVGAGERPYLIDFGIAVRRSATNALWNSLVFSRAAQMDMNSWVKLKYGRRIDPDTEPGVLSVEDAAIYRPLLLERVARAVRGPWQFITLRRPRQRWAARRNQRRDSDSSSDS
jgi:serine/threonine protein kinase